jgi:glycosyltransferase involved in cell wall biosynthesis
MVLLHRLTKTWGRKVDRYFTPTEFARRKFIVGGLPPQKIAVKPNFLPTDPGPGNGRGGYVLFVGRLSPEKGIKTLLSGWSHLSHPVPLKIVGAGPLAGDVAQAANRFRCIEFLGWRPPHEVLSMLGDAACLIIPSLCFETFGRTIIEAYAKATPVVASDLGAMAELVRDGRTGVLFNPGSAPDLASKLTALLDSTRLDEMRQMARREFLTKYTPNSNYRILMEIYGEAQNLNSKSRECLPEWCQPNLQG